MLTRNLATQIEAGIPLLRALEVQMENEASPDRPILEKLVESLQGGVSFSEALKSFPNAFPPVYQKLVESAETSGSMPSVLFELASFLAWKEKVKGLVRKASIYPVTLMTASALLVGFILAFVFPKFAPLFDKLGDELPLAAALMLSTGEFLAERWLVILAGIVAAIVGLVSFARTALGTRVFLVAVARIPVVGPTLWAIDLARFSRNLAVTSRAGIDIVQGLNLTMHAVGNRELSQGLEDIHDDILGGESLTEAMTKSELFEPMALNMIAVGEEAGRLPLVLGRISELYDRQAKESVDRMLTLMEPAVTVFLGLVVGGLAVTILGTLYKAMGAAGA